MEVDNPHSEQQFMEVDDDGCGWSDDEDYEYKDPDLNKCGSSYAPKLTSGFRYQIVSEDQVKERRQKMIDEVKEVLGVDTTQAEKKLIKNRFNKEKVLESAFDQEMESEEMVKESKFNPENEEHLCPVCF